MTTPELLHLRLHQQHPAPSATPDAAGLVAHFGAMQAQDYAQSLWAVGARLPGSTAAAVAQALTEGRLVRTWLLRGTLHLAAAADVRWLLDLVAPRLVAACAGQYRQRELDAGTFRRSFAVLEELLTTQPPQPRSALAAALRQAGIRPDGPRLYSLLQRAVWEKLICPAGRLGAEPTYTLLDNWLPPAPPRSRAEAIAELARRYFCSHGPATVADFAWWAGLPLGEARRGLEAAQPGLQTAQLDGQSYWWPADSGPAPAAPPRLLAGFDEYLVAYKNRELLLDPAHARQVLTVNGIFRPIIVVDGRVVGTWQRPPGKAGGVELRPFGELPGEAATPLAEAAVTINRFWNA
ncbi:winged helix DNA-binding domain-containing protein [Hymenobacter gummosus]|uniref:Winged helix DNA-binding domain-containing protein n=1 Tax=Hymenobacter gummosus TaxID=1776032 RepID=A0A3S0J9D0_9BACT|nr:winged helix DNA-binding domain-containing protein [Hymenobacter gummosus]RTQ48943.1 winged helix DNA-binding domain-containing protein [Hymenobacter gummosus]